MDITSIEISEKEPQLAFQTLMKDNTVTHYKLLTSEERTK